MTPGTFTAPIYKGAKYEHLLTFRDAATGSPIDLTGLNPFVFTVSHPSRDTSLATGTVTNTDLEGGRITITLTPETTDALDLGTVRIGIRDNEGNPYIASTIDVLFFAPPPP
jgi:hypothetical protein